MIGPAERKPLCYEGRIEDAAWDSGSYGVDKGKRSASAKKSRPRRGEPRTVHLDDLSDCVGGGTPDRQVDDEYDGSEPANPR